MTKLIRKWRTNGRGKRRGSSGTALCAGGAIFAEPQLYPLDGC